MKPFISKKFAAAFMALGILGFTSCSQTDNPTGGEPTGPFVVGIPSDDSATPNPDLPGDPNATFPNFQYTVEHEDGWVVIRLDVTGIQDPNNLAEWVKLYGPGSAEQNVWLSLDGVPKGFSVTNNEDDGRTKNVDLVFLVDNSGSMDDEANTLANEVYSWAQKLEASSLDMRFGCVGYDGRITGGMNLSTIDNLDAFLNASGRYGTSRTMHFQEFEGDDWTSWRNEYFVDYNVDECGVAALRLADEKFTFRNNANRVYVNFTDEPNYSRDEAKFSVEYVKDPNNWPVNKGTIHTVFSEDTTSYWTRYYWENYSYYEKPWLLSDYTGGTKKFVPYNFQGVTLDDLPVTGALTNSYIIRFTNVEEIFDGQPHEVKITILSPDGSIRAERTFILTFVG